MFGFLITLLNLSDPGGAERLLNLVRRGDSQAREDLIKKYTPLVLRVGAQVSGHYVQVGRDDEVSVGLLALNEAIDRYDSQRSGSFAAFSEMVIKRRLIDYYRRHGKHPEIPLSEVQTEDEDGNPAHPLEDRQAAQVYSADEEARERREEIARYAKRLTEFGISFIELTTVSPQHADARERALEAARIVAENPLFREHLVTRKELPLKQLEGMVGVSRKTLERQRKFIIAVALILIDDFFMLRSYIARA